MLQIWHLNLVQALRDRWGEFVKTDASTIALNKLDYEKILVKVRSVSCILTYTTLCVGETMFTIRVTVMEVLLALELDSIWLPENELLRKGLILLEHKACLDEKM